MDITIKDYQNTLFKIEDRCKWLLIDANEADKVHCHVGGIRGDIINVFPQWLREDKYKKHCYTRMKDCIVAAENESLYEILDGYSKEIDTLNDENSRLKKLLKSNIIINKK